MDSALWTTCCLVMSDPQEGTGSVRARWALGGEWEPEWWKARPRVENWRVGLRPEPWCCGPATPIRDVSHWATHWSYGADPLRQGLLGFNLLVGDTHGNKPARSFRIEVL